MGNHVVKLTDENGLSCRVRVSLPLLQNGTDRYNSDWKTLDEGFLKFRSGGCQAVDTSPGDIFTNGNLQLCSGDYYGVDLYEFLGSSGWTNDSGEGIVHQPWVVNCKAGRITWALL